MKLKKWTPILLSGALLSACGGSSSDEGSSGGGNVPEPTGRAIGEFQQIANQCEYTEPQTHVTVVVQRGDGSVLSQHQVDAQGKFDIPWGGDAKHLTTVVETDGHYSIETLMEFTTGDIGIQKNYSQALDSHCNCQDVTVDFSDFGAAYPNHQLWIGYRSQDTKSPYTYEACRVAQEDYAPLDIMLLPKDNGNDEAFGALINIDPMITSFAVSADILNEPNNQATRVNYSAGTYGIDHVHSYANSVEGRRHKSFEPAGKAVYSVPGLNQDSFIQAYRDISFGYVEPGNVDYTAYRRYRIEDPASHYELFTPTNEVELLERLNSTLANAGSSTSYDFSNLDPGYQALTLSIESANMEWQVTGALTGVIPDFKLPRAIEDDLYEQIEEFSLFTFGYNKSGNIDELRSMWAKESRSHGYLRPAYFDNYVAEAISINIEY